MGTYAEKWRKEWGAHWREYSSYYDRAAECKDKEAGLAAMECAVEVMKEIAKDRRRKGGRAGIVARRGRSLD